MFFHIASEPRIQKELQAELDALPALSQEQLAGVKLLDALINETLRLHPAVPSGTQRLTPPEGISIGDRYIPGDVMVCIPAHTMFRGKPCPPFPTVYVDFAYFLRSPRLRATPGISPREMDYPTGPCQGRFCFYPF
jgi:hypothetical protein